MTDWFQISTLAGLRITGPDAIDFAQAQFTSEFTQGRTDQWELSARCNSKGRVIEVLLTRIRDGEVELIVPAEQAAALAKALQLYSIGRRIALLGSMAVAANLSGQQTDQAMALDVERALCLNPRECTDKPESELEWRRADIRCGIAWLSAATSERFLPQALGLEERGGLSYRKGCYPGQEVIARVHYLGRAKQRLSGFQQVTAGKDATELMDAGHQAVGQLIASLDDSGGRLGLAVVSDDLAPGSTVQLGGQPAILLEPEAL